RVSETQATPRSATFIHEKTISKASLSIPVLVGTTVLVGIILITLGATLGNKSTFNTNNATFPSPGIGDTNSLPSTASFRFSDVTATASNHIKTKSKEYDYSPAMVLDGRS